jgi:hypothetical protein
VGAPRCPRWARCNSDAGRPGRNGFSRPRGACPARLGSPRSSCRPRHEPAERGGARGESVRRPQSGRHCYRPWVAGRDHATGGRRCPLPAKFQARVGRTDRRVAAGPLGPIGAQRTNPSPGPPRQRRRSSFGPARRRSKRRRRWNRTPATLESASQLPAARGPPQGLLGEAPAPAPRRRRGRRLARSRRIRRKAGPGMARGHRYTHSSRARRAVDARRRRGGRCHRPRSEVRADRAAPRRGAVPRAAGAARGPAGRPGARPPRATRAGPRTRTDTQGARTPLAPRPSEARQERAARPGPRQPGAERAWGRSAAGLRRRGQGGEVVHHGGRHERDGGEVLPRSGAGRGAPGRGAPDAMVRASVARVRARVAVTVRRVRARRLGPAWACLCLPRRPAGHCARVAACL